MRRLILTMLMLWVMPGLIYSQLNNAVYNRSDCGLNYVIQAVEITARHTNYPGNTMPVTISINGIPNSCYTIEDAFVWWTVSYRNGSPAQGVVSITNPQNTTSNINAIIAGASKPKCWAGAGGIGEVGTRCFRANVKSAITGNGNYLISVNTPQIETDGLTLIIIFKDKLATYEGHFVIYDGIITNDAGTNESQTLGGFTACANATYARAFSIVSDMQAYPDQWRFIVDGTPNNQPRDFWNNPVVNCNITQNKNNVAFEIQPVDPDCYSWAMMGIYYQTTTCRTCPTGAINLNVNPKTTGFCIGNSANISVTGAASYVWSSDPPGFSSTSDNFTVTPTVTTRYFVRGTSADGCFIDDDTVTVNVYPLPVLDVGLDRAICIGTPTILGNTSSGGTPQYTFSWTPPTGLDNPNTEFPQASPTITTTYICTMTDANGCIDIDTVVVTVNPLPQPVITASGPTTFCSCDSVTLDAGDLGYDSYQWSTNQTTQRIVVRNPGQYTVTVTDTNGCINTSLPITITVIYPSAEIALPQNYIHAEPGAMVRIPLYIRNSQYLDTCNVRNFHAIINFNKTLLVPKGNTPQGTMVGDNRILDLTGIRGTDDTLMYLDFMATLGRVPQTYMNISLFEWTDCPIPDSLFHSEFRLDSLCNAGNIIRLYNYEGVPTKLAFMPNPVESKATVEFSLAETGPTQLYISNVIGQVVRKFIDEQYEKGAYNLIFETSEIPTGLYFITLKTQTQFISKIMEVRK
ncbi:MAG: T9SS type A sorting domain-containing protein [Bacteroidetes bacterium]|nr:T9SS type A sorting domain-containing protein [Bacteroidota bacterium]